MQNDEMPSLQIDPSHTIEETPRRSLWGPLYIVAWLALASGAIAYLAALALSPDAVRISFSSEASEESDDMRALIATARIEGAETARALDLLMAEVAALKADLAELASARRADSAALGAAQPAAAQEGATASTKPASTQETGAIGSTTAATAAVTAAAPEEVEDVLTAAVRAAGSGEPDWGSEVAAQTGNGLVKAKVFGLEIAQATSPVALEAQWGQLSERHGDLLGGLTAVARPPGESEDGYRLVAGPFKNAQSAKRTCAKLSAAGVACSLTAYEGEAF